MDRVIKLGKKWPINVPGESIFKWAERREKMNIIEQNTPKNWFTVRSIYATLSATNPPRLSLDRRTRAGASFSEWALS